MVHADASNFAEGITKDDAYQQVLWQVEGLCTDQRNWVCNLANAASLLWHAYKSLPAPSKDVNWAGESPIIHEEIYLPTGSPNLTVSHVDAGFYVLDPSCTKPQLILGPFQGKVACQTIHFGNGVCGAAAASQNTQLVADVDKFPGHIACDGESKSEIVVPILAEKDGERKLVAVIDVDCAVENGFDELDKKYLEELALLLGKSCDW